MKYEWKTLAKSRLAVCHVVKKGKRISGWCTRWMQKQKLVAWNAAFVPAKTRRAINFLKQSESFDAFHRLNYAWDALQSEINSETLCNAAKHHLFCHFTAEADDEADKTSVPELLWWTIKENYRRYVLSYFFGDSAGLLGRHRPGLMIMNGSGFVWQIS